MYILRIAAFAMLLSAFFQPGNAFALSSISGDSRLPATIGAGVGFGGWDVSISSTTGNAICEVSGNYGSLNYNAVQWTNGTITVGYGTVVGIPGYIFEIASEGPPNSGVLPVPGVYTLALSVDGYGGAAATISVQVTAADYAGGTTFFQTSCVDSDTTPPSITSFKRLSPTGSQTNSDALTFEATFSENVQNVSPNDFVVNSTSTAIVSGGYSFSATKYRITVSGGDLANFNGVVGVNLAGGQNIQDLAGNALPSSEPSTDEIYTLDNVKPSVTSITGVPSVTNGSAPFSVTITYDEAVLNAINNGDITATNASVGTISAGTGNTFTAIITPNGGGNVDVNVPAGVANDAAGNTNNAGTTQTATLDNVKPSVASITGVPAVTNGSTPFIVTITYDEAVFNATDAGDITATNAAVGSISSGSGNTYLATITPNGSGNVVVNVPAGIAVDIVGNTNNAGIPQTSILDDIGPTVEILGAPETHDRVTSFSLTFEFSENVTNFDSVGDITVINGTVSNFQTVDGNTYTADITPTGPLDISIDVASGVAQDAATNINTAAAQVIVGSTIVEDTQKAIASFMHNRANHILANQPDLISFVDGTNNANSSQMGNLALNGDDDGMTLAFSSSLSRIKGYADRRITQAFGNNEEKEASSTSQYDGQDISAPRFDIWTEIYGSTSNAGDADSNLWVGYFGAHYFVTPDFLVGALAQVDWADETNSSLGSNADGNGWMIGPYMAGRIPGQNLYYEARASWGKSSNSVSPIGTYSDDFDTTRWLVSGKINGAYKMGSLTIKPEASISWFEETQEAYTDSLSNYIPSQKISLGEVRFGPSFVQAVNLDNGVSLQPSIGISGVWNFGIEENAASQGFALGNNDLRARLDGSLATTNSLGWVLSVSGFYDGLGLDDYQTYGGSIKLAIPLY